MLCIVGLIGGAPKIDAFNKMEREKFGWIDITEDNPVRVVDAFVDVLDLSELGFSSVHPQVTGRPGYHPASMLKLYVYGYLNKIQSSRRLERESNRNLELVWLLNRLAPDFKTIADFRRDNAKGIKSCCRQFVMLCKQLNLFADSLIAIDGSRFKAVNNRDRNYTQAKVKRRIEAIDKSIDRYLGQLESFDRQDRQTPKAKTLHIHKQLDAMTRLTNIMGVKPLITAIRVH